MEREELIVYYHHFLSPSQALFEAPRRSKTKILHLSVTILAIDFAVYT